MTQHNQYLELNCGFLVARGIRDRAHVPPLSSAMQVTHRAQQLHDNGFWFCTCVVLHVVWQKYRMYFCSINILSVLASLANATLRAVDNKRGREIVACLKQFCHFCAGEHRKVLHSAATVRA